VAPRQIPYVAGMAYFELERNVPLWRELQSSGGIAIHAKTGLTFVETEAVPNFQHSSQEPSHGRGPRKQSKRST